MPSLQPSGLSRRTLLKGLGAGAAVAWTAPVVISLATAATAASGLASFDLTTDYVDTSTANPNGPWSYNYSSGSSPDEPVSLLSTYAEINGFSPGTVNAFEGGQDSNTNATFPFVAKNTSGTPQTIGTGPTELVYEPGDVYGHPGNSAPGGSGTDLLIRFTSPYPNGTSATVTISATKIQNCGDPVNVTVYLNGVPQSTGSSSFEAAYTFSSNVPLGSAAVIDLVISSSTGSNGYDCDSTLLTFHVTPS